jgi:glycosyltransferase involved in cell wall biosynthesis
VINFDTMPLSTPYPSATTKQSSTYGTDERQCGADIIKPRQINDAMISVIIPHLNQPDGLEACLRSFEAQSLDRSLFEIIVVDNGSAVAPHEVVARYPSARLILEPQPGPGPARNTGARLATGDVFAFIDADCRAHPDWLRTIQQTMLSLPPGMILGGDVRIWRADLTRFTAIEAYEGVFGFRNELYVTKHGYSITANLAVRRADLEKIGPFAGIQFAEDMLWGQLALNAGCQFRYVPEMIVFHPARRSLGQLYAKWDRQIQHYLNIAQDKPAWRFRWIARALLILGSPIADCATVFSSDRIQGMSARLRAIPVLCKIRTHRAFKMLSLLYAGKSIVWNRNIGV